jgi:hypothetical protein
MCASEENPLNARMEIHCKKHQESLHIFNEFFLKDKNRLRKTVQKKFFYCMYLVSIRTKCPKCAVKTTPKFIKILEIGCFILLLICVT